MSARDRQVAAWDCAIKSAHFGSGTFEVARIYSAAAGEDASDAAARMTARAELTQVPVLCSFNGTPMLAKPGDRPGAVVRQWLTWREGE